MTVIPSVTPPLGSASKDLDFTERIIAESYQTFQARYPYHELKALADQGSLNVYNEVDYSDNPYPSKYKDPVQLPMVLILEPEQDVLDRFGLDEPQEAVGVVSNKLCRDLSVTPKIGDRIDFNEWQLEIKTVKDTGWFSNAKFPCESLLTLERVLHRDATSS